MTIIHLYLPEGWVKDGGHSEEREISFHLKFRKGFVEEVPFELSFVIWK